MVVVAPVSIGAWQVLVEFASVGSVQASRAIAAGDLSGCWTVWR